MGKRKTIVATKKAETFELNGNGLRRYLTISGSEMKGRKEYSNKLLKLRAGAGDDKVRVGGTGRGTFNAKVANGQQLYTEAGNDTVIIVAGNNHLVHGGTGKDSIFVNVGTGHKIYGDSNADSVFLNGVKKTEVDGGSGGDIIMVSHSTGTKVEGGSGNDRITLSNGSTGTYNGGTGDDIIEVGSGTKKATLVGGSGNDGYFFEDSLAKGVSITINQKSAGREDKDFIRLRGDDYFTYYKVDDLNLYAFTMKASYSKGTMTLDFSRGGKIVVKNWDNSAIKGVFFADGKSVSAQTINNWAGINASIGGANLYTLK